MGVDPDPSELLRSPSRVDLGIEELRDRAVFERHSDHRTVLPDEDHILDQQQVVRRADPEAADFRRPGITQEQQLGPGGGTKP